MRERILQVAREAVSLGEPGFSARTPTGARLLETEDLAELAIAAVTAHGYESGLDVVRVRTVADDLAYVALSKRPALTVDQIERLLDESTSSQVDEAMLRAIDPPAPYEVQDRIVQLSGEHYELVAALLSPPPEPDDVWWLALDQDLPAIAALRPDAPVHTRTSDALAKRIKQSDDEATLVAFALGGYRRVRGEGPVSRKVANAAIKRLGDLRSTELLHLRARLRHPTAAKVIETAIDNAGLVRDNRLRVEDSTWTLDTWKARYGEAAGAARRTFPEVADRTLRQHQFAALARECGWQYKMQGRWDGNDPRASFEHEDVIAELWVEPAGEATEVFSHVVTQRLTIDGDPSERVLSEILRDVDLFDRRQR